MDEYMKTIINALKYYIANNVGIDPSTLEQMREMIKYMDSNKDLIDSITTNKVDVSDIVNDLETNDDKKVLSASVAVQLKQMIDTLEKGVEDLKNKEPEEETKAVRDFMVLRKYEETISYSTSHRTFMPLFGSVIVDGKSEETVFEFAENTVNVGDRTGVIANGIKVNKDCVIRVTGNVRYENGSPTGTILHTYLNVLLDGEVFREGATSGWIANEAPLSQHTDVVLRVFKDSFIFLESYKGNMGRNIDVLAGYNGTTLTVELIELIE